MRLALFLTLMLVTMLFAGVISERLLYGEDPENSDMPPFMMLFLAITLVLTLCWYGAVFLG